MRHGVWVTKINGNVILTENGSSIEIGREKKLGVNKKWLFGVLSG